MSYRVRPMTNLEKKHVRKETKRYPGSQEQFDLGRGANNRREIQ